MPFDGIGFQVETKPLATEPWRQVLLDAADYIEAHGWCPETSGHMMGVGDNGEVCPAVAVANVVVNDGDMEAANQAFQRWSGGANFISFNRRCMDATEVTAALRSCAVQP